MGALAATYCLEEKGTQNHKFTIQEFISRYREVFDDQGKLDCLLNEQELGENKMTEHHVKDLTPWLKADVAGSTGQNVKCRFYG